MKYLILLLIALLSLASSCQKEDMHTDEHKNIFRCKVNGVEWTPHCISDPLFGCDAVDCQYYKEDKSIQISSKVNIMTIIDQLLEFISMV
ncbi:MAG: hypothetical protein IPJ06_18555 [Saprospiraceae bacterium]|nr:hypothetical protein [Saprospiraceae bacterium]